MKAVNRYIFEVPEKEAYKQKLGDKEIYFDAGFGNEFDHMVHYGKLVSKPKSAKLDIKEGEIVYFSHLAKSHEQRVQIKDKVYYCLDKQMAEGTHGTYQIILCAEDRPLGNVTIVERIDEPEENYKVGGIYIKPKPDTLKNQYRVSMSNQFEVGTEIIISEDADYDFQDKDKNTRIAVQDEHIVAVVKDDGLEPYGDYEIIEPLDDKEKEDFVEKGGVFVPKQMALRGWGRWKEKDVYYHKVNSNNFEFEKKPYSACLVEDIYLTLTE